MATYRQGPYIVEESYAMVNQDGEEAHQHTFAETANEAIDRLRSVLGFDEYEAQSDL